MNPFLHNPIADMYGPDFLLFYAVICIAAFCVVRAYLRNLGSQAPLPPVSPAPEPCAIAFLRGGENEVIRATVVAMLTRGALLMEAPLPAKRTARRPATLNAGDPSAIDEQSPIERDVFDFCGLPRTPGELFGDRLAAGVKSACLPYARRFSDERLLTEPADWRVSSRPGVLAALGVVGLGAYKLVAATANGHHNVGFLIAEIMAASIAFASVLKIPRLTAAGKRYIERLQQAYSGLQKSGLEDDSNRVALVAAVFGMGALAATPQSAYAEMFQKAGASSGGCGSSSGCGSSCGGGGGGGCGGCGGGH